MVESKVLDDIVAKYYLFNPSEYGRVYTFVDFGNVRHWAKELWKIENKYRISVEVDIAKLSDICDLVKPIKKIFYYGYFSKERTDLDDKHPLNEKYRKSIYRIDKARKKGFETKSKEIKIIPLYDEDGKFIKKIAKCNFDVEITMDILQKIEKYDTILLLSGDGDFYKLLSHAKNKGKKIIKLSPPMEGRGISSRPFVWLQEF